MDEHMDEHGERVNNVNLEPLMPLSMPHRAAESADPAPTTGDLGAVIDPASIFAPTADETVEFAPISDPTAEFVPLMPLSMPYEPPSVAVGISGSGGAGGTPPPFEFANWASPGDGSSAHHHRLSRRRIVALVAAVAVVAGGVGGAIGALSQNGGSGSGSGGIASLPSSSDTAIAPSSSKSTGNIVTSVAAEVTPAVVDIQTTIATQTGTSVQQAAGTGMIVTPSGEVVTNNHVIADATSIKVSIQGHSGLYKARVLGVDPPQSSDVALLQIDGVSNLPYVHLGDSSQVKVGQPVVAIGNALGMGGNPTVVNGIVSALGRTINASDSTGLATETLHNMIQTDAQIVPGDSGGPLVNSVGQVIGMDTAALSQAQTGAATMGFAIPINTVRTIVTNIENHVATGGIILGESPYLGIFEQTSTPISGNGFGFNFGNSGISGNTGSTGNTGATGNTGSAAPVVSGVVLGGVATGSPADQAGLVTGDVITSINGTKTPTWTGLVNLMKRFHPGETVSLTFQDVNGVSHSVSLVLAGIPK